MKKKMLWVIGIILILILTYFFIPGLMKNSSAVVTDYTVSADGREITIRFSVSSSIGYIRDVTVHQQQGGKLYLDCYSAFGGPNGRIGAKDTFSFRIDENTSTIAVYRNKNAYEEVLVKAEDGSWHRPGQNADEIRLKEKYPEYFGLSTMKGLEVYVWQIVPNSYNFGVLEGTNREKTLEELWNLKGATAEEMRVILSSYDIEENDVIVIPWQNPISSYIAEYWIMEKDEDPDSVAKRQQEYIDRIRAMLFDFADSTDADISCHADWSSS